MAVVERERVTTAQRPERAVFVASDGRRARRLRRAAFAAAFLACLWLVGLGVGMLGSGSLPGVSIVKEQIDGIAGASDSSGSQPTEIVSPLEQKSVPDESRRVAATSRSRAVRSKPGAGTRPVASRPVSRPPTRVTPPAPPAAQTPLNPATRERGWSRRGSIAPPGQTRNAVTPPPPSTRGQRRGQDPTALPPVAPGQEKKAQTPPPPASPLKKA
jgi:hypothetical protein